MHRFDERKKNIYLIRAVETSCDDFANHIHEVFRFLDDVINFTESCCTTYCRLFHCKLQLLNIRRHFI